MIASAEGLRGTFRTTDIKAALAQLAQHLKGFLAVTDGPEGVFFMKGGEVRHMPAFKVEAVDTLGAGDAFHGAFTVALVERGDVIQAMRFARGRRRDQMHAVRRADRRADARRNRWRLSATRAAR